MGCYKGVFTYKGGALIKGNTVTYPNLLMAHKVVHFKEEGGGGGYCKCLLCFPVEGEEGDEALLCQFDKAIDLDYHLERCHAHMLGWSRKGNKKEANVIPGICDDKKFTSWKGGKWDPCRFCGVKVKERGMWGLRAHERKAHSGEFKWECTDCEVTFMEENAMRTCQGSPAPNEESYQCLLCHLK